MNPSKKKINAGQSGCVFIVGVGLIMTFLLICNAIFVKIFFSVNLAGIDDRIFHAAQFVIPIVLIFIQFWFFDRVFGRKKRRSQDNP